MSRHLQSSTMTSDPSVMIPPVAAPTKPAAPLMSTLSTKGGYIFRKHENSMKTHERPIFPHERNQDVTNPARWGSAYLNTVSAAYNREHFTDLLGDYSQEARDTRERMAAGLPMFDSVYSGGPEQYIQHEAGMQSGASSQNAGYDPQSGGQHSERGCNSQRGYAPSQGDYGSPGKRLGDYSGTRYENVEPRNVNAFGVRDVNAYHRSGSAPAQGYSSRSSGYSSRGGRGGQLSGRGAGPTISARTPTERSHHVRFITARTGTSVGRDNGKAIVSGSRGVKQSYQQQAGPRQISNEGFVPPSPVGYYDPPPPQDAYLGGVPQYPSQGNYGPASTYHSHQSPEFYMTASGRSSDSNYARNKHNFLNGMPQYVPGKYSGKNDSIFDYNPPLPSKWEPPIH